MKSYWKWAITVLMIWASPWYAQKKSWNVLNLAHKAGHPTLDYEEGETGITWIEWADEKKTKGSLFAHGRLMGFLPETQRHQKQGSVLLSFPRREKVLVLGLGQGGVIKELLKDPMVKEVAVVDWSFELAKILRREPAARMIEYCLEDPRVRLYKADARIAVTLFPEQSFDIVYDNLVYPAWIGSSNVRSQSFFERVKRILKPEGYYALTTNYSGRSREAILSGFQKLFPFLHEDLGNELLIGGEKPLRGREAMRVLTKVPPIREDLLIYEYTDLQNKSWIERLYYPKEERS